MMFVENVRLALFGLKANKMRALLTMLGIIIGIASVIAIMTLGDSVTQTVTDNMSSIGANNVMVSLQQRETEEEDGEEGTSSSGSMSMSSGSSAMGLNFGEDDSSLQPTQADYITWDMLNEFYNTYEDSIQAISAYESVGTGEIQDGEKTSGVSVMGASLGYFLANNIEIVKGSYFGEKELNQGEMVALVAEDVVDDIFDGDMDAAVGSSVQVSVNDKYYNFIISGVYEESNDMYGEYSMFYGGSATDFYIPLRTAQALNHTSGYTQFTIVTTSDVNADDFCAQVKEFFGNLYRNNRHFEVTAMSMSAMVEMMSSMMGTITTAIAFIAGIALVVGGIGVMNIMLVSITERTREIGTRKALGAPNSSIRMQFIIESIVICIIGGIFGIILGCIVGMAAAAYVGVSVIPSLKSILISLGFSMAIGIFFGYYPANKAAKLNPIDALRYE